MKPADRPNVILITTDQQRKDALSCYGSAFVDTPHLDRMAAEGILCDRAYCTNSVCTPSRTSLYSGQYVSRHGNWNVGTIVSPEIRMLPHLFSDEGYRTHHIGKAHFQPYSAGADVSMESTREWERIYPEFRGPYYGFETVEMAMGHTTGGTNGHYGAWLKERCGDPAAFPRERRSSVPFGAAAVDWELPGELRNTAWVEERTTAFLREHAQTGEVRPFFLSVGFQDPHHPHALPPEWRRDLDVARMPAPTFVPGELDDKPPFFKDVHTGAWSKEHPLHGAFPLAGQAGSGSAAADLPMEDQLLARAYYYRMVEMIDAACGNILRELDDLGIAERTIIVFTSDHGELLGDHGFWLKGPFHYEQLINVPLLLRWKGAIPEGQTLRDIVSLADVAPTLLSLCGIGLPGGIDGCDFSARLKGAAEPARRRALIETIDDPAKIRVKTIVTAEWKLTCYPGQSYGELIDLANDPGERRNLWGDPAYQAKKAELFGELLAELESMENRNVRYSYA
jgi:arylsulfatase A-like enzyme